MLNRIIQFSLNNRLAVLLCAVLLMIAGLYVMRHIEVDVFPDLNAPTVVVMTEANGMAPEEVERMVTFPVEAALNGATDVRRVRSSTTTGFSVVWVEFDWGTDIYRARQIVSEKLALLKDALPEGVGTPVMGPQSSILGEVMIIAMSVVTPNRNDGFTPASHRIDGFTPSEAVNKSALSDLRTLADWVVRPRLLATGGVAQASVIGGDVREYQILLHPDKMNHYRVSVAEALAAVRAMNRNVSGGVMYEFGNEYIIQGAIASSDVEALGRSVVKTGDGRRLLLESFATVKVGSKSPKLGVAANEGAPAVIITVTKQPNVSTLELTEKLDQTLADIQRELPDYVHISTDVFRQSRFIESSIDNVKDALLEGAVFVVIVLFIFLMNVRTTIISLVTIPLSLLTSILALKCMGLTINTMSLGGMAISIGSLVDDAIVDVENVFKRLKENRLKPQAERLSAMKVVYEASCEVRNPILNSTLIIVVSFVPLFFLSGMEGRMLAPLGVAFIVALAASTVVALTLTPVLCSYLLTGRKDDKGDSIVPNNAIANRTADDGVAPNDAIAHEQSPIASFESHGFTSSEAVTTTTEAVTSSTNGLGYYLAPLYLRALRWTLRHKTVCLSVTGVIFAAALFTFFTFGRSFLPSFNEGSFTVNISALPGVSLEESDRIGRMAEEALLSIPEIITTGRKTGRAELDEHSFGVNSSEIEAPFALGKRSKEELLKDMRDRLSILSGVNIEVGQPVSHRIDAMLSGTRANIAIKLFGDDLNRLYSLANRIKAEIQAVEGIADLNVEQQTERPQLRIKPRRELLARYGVTMPEFNEALTVMLSGETVSQVYEGSRAFDLTVKADEESRSSMERIRLLPVDVADGKAPLANLTDVVSTTGPNTINRENVQRRIVVSANAAGRDLHSIVADIRQRIEAEIKLPEGYYIVYGGQFESEQAASRTLLTMSIFAIIVVFLLLFNQVRSLPQATAILLNLPLALIGSVFAILFTGGVISIPAIIGFISLFGIATRNGMLLVTRYNDLRRSGLSLSESVLQGSADRLNPILMTALTTALGLIPLALGGDLPGNELQSPMAKVILGGLLTSTALNGFVVPMVYMLLGKKRL